MSQLVIQTDPLDLDQLIGLLGSLQPVQKQKVLEALNQTQPEKRELPFNKFKGQIIMADDFEAPLDAFKEYTPD